MRRNEEFMTEAFVEEMGRRVFAAALELDGDFWGASAKIWKTLPRSEQYTLGLWALVHAERQAFRNRHPTIDGEAGHHPVDAHITDAPFSRRAEALLGRDPLIYVVAVGNSGIRKPVGELTRDDLDRMVAYYGSLKRSYTEKESGWRSIALKTPPGRTVASIEKRLSATDRAFLLSDLGTQEGKPVPNEAAAA